MGRAVVGSKNRLSEKNQFDTRRRRIRLAACASVAIPAASILLRAQTANAATQYWDLNGNGTWSITVANWSPNSAGGSDGNFTTGSDVVFSSGGVTTTNPITITTTTLSANTTTFNGNGSGGYTFTNGGVLTLGNTTTGGTIILLNSGAGPVTFNGGITFPNNGGITQTITNNSSSLLTLAGQVGNNGNTSGNLDVTGTGTGGVTFSGALVNNYGSLAGTGRNTALVINTTGSGATAVTTLSGGTGNIYAGGTTITSGILATTVANSLGDDNALTANSGALSIAAAGQLNLSGTNQGVGAFSGSAGALVYNNSNTSATLTIGNDNNGGGTYAGTLENNNNSNATSGTLSLVKNGTATITLTGTNSYSGSTTIKGGVLEFTIAKALYNSTAGSVSTNGNVTASNLTVQAGGTLALEMGNTGGFNAADVNYLQALGNGSSGGFQAGSFLGIDTTGGNQTFNSALITNTNGLGLNKLGSNSLIFTAAQTYSGPTLITAGTLQIGNGTVAMATPLATPSILDGGTLLLEPSAGNTQTYTQNIGGTGALTVNGNSSGKVVLQGIGTFTGATSVTGGTLDLQNSLALQNSAVSFSGTGAITFDSAVTSNAFTFGSVGTTANNSYVLQNNASTPAPITLTIGNPTDSANSTTSGAFSGAGSLTLAGFLNTITLTGANLYTGTTTVTGSTLNLGGAGANGSISASSALVLGGIDSGGTLSYTRVSGTTAESQTFASTTINAGESSITTSTGNQTLNLGTITGNAGGTVDINPNTTSSITTATTTNTNGILGGYATYGGKATWAVAPGTSGGNITGLAAGSYTETATAGNTTSNYTNQNIDVNGSATFTSPINPNSLRFNSSTTYTLTLTGLNTITTGGILVTPTGTGAGTITGGTLTGSAGGQLAVSIGGTSQTAVLTLSSLIVDNGGATAVTLSAPNPDSNSATLDSISLNNANNSYSGGTFLNGGGSVKFASGGTAFGTGTVTLGSQYGSDVSYGDISFNGGATLTSGLLASAMGNNEDPGNDEIGSNTGGTWTLIGAPGSSATYNGSTGGISSTRAIGLVLDGGTEIFGAMSNTGSFNGFNALTVNGGTLQLGNGYSGVLQDQTTKVVLGGGTFAEVGNVAGFYSQTITNGITVNSGGSTLVVNSNGGAGTVFSPGAITRNVGGTVNFSLPTAQGGSQTATNGITTTTTNTNGILGGYATVGGTDWATNSTNASGGNIIGLSASTINSYTNDTWAAGDNTTVTGNDTIGSGNTTNSLRFNAPGANTVTLAGTNILTSGGLLVTPNVVANPTTITGGTLEGGNGTDLVVIQNNTTGNLTIASTIANNTSATALTKSGAGTLVLSGANSYTGALYLNGGILNGNTSNINGGNTTNGIVFNGGTLQAAAGGITTAKAVTVGINGATIDTTGGNVTLSGNVTKDGGNEFAGAGAFGGFNATGVGALTVTGGNTLTLSGTASTFGGGLVISNGTVLDSAASGTGTLGSGYVTFGASNTPTLNLGNHSVVVAGLIGSGNNGIITANSGASTLTLDGVLNANYGGVIQNGTGSIALTLNLNSPLDSQTLSGNNTYTGATLVSVGTLTAGVASTYSGGNQTSGAFGVNSAVTLGNSTSPATLNLGTFSNQIGSLAGGGTLAGTVNVGVGATLTVGGSNINTSFAGTIGGSGAFLMNASGNQTFTGANSYTGGTTVSAGNLFANNATSSLGNGAVSVYGGRLAGNGKIANGSNVLTVYNGGTIGAGATASLAGNLSTGSQAWNSGGTYAWKITGANQGAGNSSVAVGSGGSGTIGGGSGVEGSDWDQLVMSGLSLNSAPGSPFTIALTANNPTGGTAGQYSWVIAQTGSSALPNGNITVGDNLLPEGTNSADAGLFALNTTNFTFNGVNAPSESDFSLEFEPLGSGGNLDLVLDYNYAAAPEPGTAMLVLAGALPMLTQRRRRRRNLV
jgi:autotransporter-associated beta strand protein